jgi:hypothetical protein
VSFSAFIRKTKKQTLYFKMILIYSVETVVSEKTVKGVLVMSFGSDCRLKPADTLNFVAWSPGKFFFYTTFNWHPLKLSMNFQ